MEGISVIILTLNEERNIGRCLRSVGWADEVVVVDSFSTDRTMDICSEGGAKVIRHEYDSDLRQRERGFAVARFPWLLVVDADEEIPPELAAEIREVVARASGPGGYYIPRKVSFLGKWIMHGGWYPGHTFRLFRRDSVVVEDAAVHGGYTVRGEKGYLENAMYHYSYDSIAHYIAKMNDYTSLQVSNLVRSKPGYRPGFGKLLVSPLSHFVRNYFTRRGYRDGYQGFLLAVLDAVYALALYAKLWEYRTRDGKGDAPPVDMESIRALKRRYAR